uniref:Putative ovule protein n=1 Tax=Solanum chacoense TaxID=4108 RepID=A0A0V0I140_SOLCH
MSKVLHMIIFFFSKCKSMSLACRSCIVSRGFETNRILLKTTNGSVTTGCIWLPLASEVSWISNDSVTILTQMVPITTVHTWIVQ